MLGGGFAGLACVRALRKAPCEVVLVDRRNHHLFQPLLYQVATAGLSPANIASPIRKIVGRQRNVTVVLGEAQRIDPDEKTVRINGHDLPYDHLVVACGMTHAYFGHDEWAAFAPGLKTVEDALEIRRRILLAFEAAEVETDPDARRAELTFVLVGGGPTGVELAGAIKEIAVESIPKDFKRVDTRSARVLLVEGQGRLLPAFPPELSDRAKRDLEALGVEVRLNTLATAIDAEGVELTTKQGDETTTGRVASRCVVWSAGLKAEPVGTTLGAETDKAGRVKVGPDLAVPAHPAVFVVGDQMAYDDPETGEPVPGVAQGALQSGRFVGKLIADGLAGNAGERPTFRYHDKGLMATIGRARAVAKVGSFKLGGFVAWVLWSAIHIAFLVGFRNKVLAMLEWSWLYLFWSRGARLITGRIDPKTRGNGPSDDTPGRDTVSP